MRGVLTLCGSCHPSTWCAIAVVAGETAVIFGLLVPGEAALLPVAFPAYVGTPPATTLMVAAGRVAGCYGACRDAGEESG